MRMRLLVAAALATLLLGAPGCATVLKGTDEEVSFNSEPEGATVEVDGTERGKTPVTLKLDTSNEYSIKITKSGYEPFSGRMKHEIGTTWLILDIVFFGLPLAVDAVTGAWYEFEPGAFSVTLEKKGPGAPPEKRVELSEKARKLSAKKLFKRGVKHYGDREYEEALAYFQAAHEKSPSPVLLYNVAITHSRLGEHERALATIDKIEDRSELPKKVRTKLEALEAANRLIVRGHRMVIPES